MFDSNKDDAAQLATTLAVAIEQPFELPVKVVVLPGAVRPGREGDPEALAR